MAALLAAIALGGCDEPDPELRLCNAAMTLVKRHIPLVPPDRIRRVGQCQVSDEGHLKRVRWSYSTPLTRMNDWSPLPFEALMAQHGRDYFLCEVVFDEDDVVRPSRHRLCPQTTIGADAPGMTRL